MITAVSRRGGMLPSPRAIVSIVLLASAAIYYVRSRFKTTAVGGGFRLWDYYNGRQVRPPMRFCSHKAATDTMPGPSSAEHFAAAFEELTGEHGMGCYDLDASPFLAAGGEEFEASSAGGYQWAIGHPKDLTEAGGLSAGSPLLGHELKISDLAAIIEQRLAYPTDVTEGEGQGDKPTLSLLKLEPKVAGLDAAAQVVALTGLAHQLHHSGLLPHLSLVLPPTVVANFEAALKDDAAAKPMLASLTFALPVRDDQDCRLSPSTKPADAKAALDRYAVVMPSVACWGREDVRKEIVAWQARQKGGLNKQRRQREIGIWTVDDCATARAALASLSPEEARQLTSPPFLVSNRAPLLQDSCR